MPEPHVRASDSDRTAVATALGEHMAAGRLTLAEYEERLTQVYETKTFGGLAALTADLPPTPKARTAAVPPADQQQHAHVGVCGSSSAGWGNDTHAWEAWRRTAIIVIGIWAITSLASWALLYFWPVWVLGPWGAVLLARTIGGRRDGDRRERRRLSA